MRTKLLQWAGVIGICFLGASCTTTYDAQGRPVQSVSPEGAAIAAVAAGIIGYAIADDDDDNYCGYRGYRGYRGRGRGYGGCGSYYAPVGYRRGGYGGRRYCR